MYKHTIIRMFSQLTLLLVILGLAACSGDDLTGTELIIDEATTVDTTGDGTVSSIRIGSTVDGVFQDGAILIPLLDNSLSAGKQVRITVNLVDENGDPVTTSTTVIFTSRCVGIGEAELINATETTEDGIIIVTYDAQICTGDDTVTATLRGTEQIATGIIRIASADAGSIELLSVSNSLIALSGTGSASGLPETSTVKFIVKDNLGLPVQGEEVTLSLNSKLGGLSLSSDLSSGIVTSDGFGEVITTVQSGTVATSVRVTATLLNSDPVLTTTSTAIAIATGPPDQDSMSLAASELNPRAWDINGKEVTISAFLADRYNNPITDGTAISFTTELGSIDPSCTTTNGGCNVIWRSQNPRVNNLPENDITNDKDGITTIMATVEGEESFTDFDVDGVFSDGDTFVDKAEAFRDDNDNGIYDAGEFYVDFNVDGILNDIDPANDSLSGNGLYNGKGCELPSPLCDLDVDSITVRQSINLVMAEDNPAVYAIVYSGGYAVDYDYDGGVLQNPESPPTFSTLTNRLISFTIGGLYNGQILPVGTKLTFSTTNGKITSGASHTILNGVSPADTYTVSITNDATSSNDGDLTLKIDISNGGGTFENIYPFPIEIDDRSKYTIGGTVTGLPVSESLVIQNNAGDYLTVSTNGSFVFNTSIIDGSAYNVTIKTQPATPICNVISGGSGTLDSDDWTDVVIECN